MLKGGVLAYSIKWKGWDSKHNTMEPLCNLPEVTAEIAAFEKRAAKRQKDLDAVIARREAAKAACDENRKIGTYSWCRARLCLSSKSNTHASYLVV